MSVCPQLFHFVHCSFATVESDDVRCSRACKAEHEVAHDVMANLVKRFWANSHRGRHVLVQLKTIKSIGQLTYRQNA